MSPLQSHCVLNGKQTFPLQADSPVAEGKPQLDRVMRHAPPPPTAGKVTMATTSSAEVHRVQRLQGRIVCRMQPRDCDVQRQCPRVAAEVTAGFQQVAASRKRLFR